MIDDGRHRRFTLVPDPYKHFSNTTSGWTISTNPLAEKDKRWRAVHPKFGEKFFAQHDDILPWTLNHMRDLFFKNNP